MNKKNIMYIKQKILFIKNKWKHFQKVLMWKFFYYNFLIFFKRSQEELLLIFEEYYFMIYN